MQYPEHESDKLGEGQPREATDAAPQGFDPVGASVEPSVRTTPTHFEAATDFLGLDQDLTAGNAGPGGAIDPQAAPSQSWLLSLEGDPHAHQGPFTTVGDPRALAPDELAAQEAGAAGLDGPPAEATQAELEPEAAPAHRRAARWKPLAALAATALLGCGAWFGWQWWSAQQAAPDDSLATRPPAQPARPPKQPAPAQPVPPPVHDATATPPVAVAVPTEPAPTGIEPAPTTEPAPPAEFAFGPRTSDVRVAEFVAAQTGQGLPAESEFASGTSGSSALSPLAFVGISTGFVSSAEPSAASESGLEYVDPNPATPLRATRRTGRGGLRLASDADLASIWEGATVPLEAIDADTRLLTPEVGRVRVTIHGSEIFEGRLYAVGQKQVWLDTELGRMGIAAVQVARIEQLSSADGTPILGQAGSQVLAGLPRVRVKTPGGMLYGKIIARDERSLTLITDGGARITVDATDFEPAPASRSIIVRGSAREAAAN